MKIGKQELKALIKECLIEVLTSGLGEQLTESVKMRPAQSSNTRQPVVHHSTLNQPKQRQQAPALVNAINEAAGSDDIMREIFADTAQKTLPSMLSERRSQQPVGTSVEDQVVDKHEPAEIFGSENVDRWAALAFKTPLKK